MIRQLHLTNFKPFTDFTVEFSGRNVLIGPNNAGKSSIVQALRAVDLALRSFNRTGQREFTITDNRIPFSLRSARNLYTPEDELAQVTCEFTDGESVTITIGIPGQGMQAFIDSSARRTQNLIGFLPPVGPLEEDERILDRDHVRRTMNTYLAPRHFRNLWYHFADRIDEFAKQLALTWPGVTLGRTQPNPELSPAVGNLYMFYAEERVEREVAWAGTGLQIWMQILTFLVKSGDEDILVLDEPELYLHADVQRKIGVAALGVRASQVVIATHSVEIVNEVEPEQIVTVDHSLASSKRLFDIGAVQEVLTRLGSTQNIQLSRLARTRKCLFVEGDDFRILKRMAVNLASVSWEEGRDFSIFPLEGFDRWPLLEGVDWAFKNILEERIQAFVILDRDYRTESAVENVRGRLQRVGVRCHIWEKKELENYLLAPDLIGSVAAQMVPASMGVTQSKIISSVDQWLDDIAEELRDETHAQMLAEFHKEQMRSGKSDVTVNREFNQSFSLGWQCFAWRLSRIGGKEALGKVNQRLQQQYKVAVSTTRLASAITSSQAPPELIAVVQDLSRFARSATTA